MPDDIIDFDAEKERRMTLPPLLPSMKIKQNGTASAFD